MKISDLSKDDILLEISVIFEKPEKMVEIAFISFEELL